MMEQFDSKRTARLAGLLYLILAPIGILGVVYVPYEIFIPNDISATISNITANGTIYRLSIICAFIAPVLTIIVAILLYKILAPVNKTLSTLMVLLISLAAPIAMLNELNKVAIFALINDATLLSEFTNTNTHGLIALFMNLHEAGLIVAAVFWGLWLFPLGYMVYRSGFLPKILGILLIIACFGYLADTVRYFMYPQFNIIFTEFTFVGEILFPLWLLLKGLNVEAWHKMNISH